LLKAHEEYSESLRDELESKATIIPKVREWHTLVEEEEELERLSSDPNRFKMRGGALLREEKLRKRIQVLKPRVSWPEISRAKLMNRSRVSY
jgi:protein regulator of cytokinesis 1